MSKVIGPYAHMLEDREWEAFASAHEKGFLRLMVPLSQDDLDKLNAGKGVLALMGNPPISLLLLPVAGLVSSLETHQPTDAERELVGKGLSDSVPPLDYPC